MTRLWMLAATLTILLVRCSALQLRSPNETSTESALGATQASESSPSKALLGTSLNNALDLLWQGSDSLNIEEWKALSAYIKSISVRKDSQQPRAVALPKPKGLPKLQILGMFDSGTNLMGALLSANMDTSSFLTACPGGDGYSCHFWKHTPPEAVPAMLDRDFAIAHEKNVVVAMVRSPLAHILGWELSPYDLIFSCLSHQDVPMKKQEAETCTIAEQNFAGLTGLWNSYTKYYDELKSAYPGLDVFVVEYEKLVLDPEPIVREIVAALEFQPQQPLPFVSVEEPAKSHGHRMARTGAEKKIKDRAYLNQAPLNFANDQMLCRHLDTTAMKRHIIPIDPPTPYSSDCSPRLDRAHAGHSKH